MDVINAGNASGPGFVRTPSAAPPPDAAAAPPPPSGTPDQNLVASKQFAEVGDLGDLPWDAAPAGPPQAPPVPSEERKEAIRAMYREYMGREVSDHGLNYWAHSSSSLDEIRSVVAASPEAAFYQGMKGGVGFANLDTYHTADPAQKLELEKMLNLVGHPTRESHLAAAQDVFTSSLEFKALGPRHQDTLRTFFDESAKGASSEQVNELALGILSGLKKERFTPKDAFGQTTLDHLMQFNERGLVVRGEDKPAMGRDLLNALVHPDTLTQGKDTLDCAEATLEATLAYGQPADYARIAVGLLTAGSARIPGPPGQAWDPEGGYGTPTLQLANTGEAAGRDRLSFYMQRSFEAHVASRAEDEYGWRGPQDKGLDAHQVKLLYDGVIGKEHVTIVANPGMDVTSAIEQALSDQKSPNPAVKVTMRDGDVLHAKAVVGSSPTDLTLWDPATGKIETLSKEEFNRQVARVTLAGHHGAMSGRWRFGGENDDGYSYSQSEGGGRSGRSSRLG